MGAAAFLAGDGFAALFAFGAERAGLLTGAFFATFFTDLLAEVFLTAFFAAFRAVFFAAFLLTATFFMAFLLAVADLRAVFLTVELARLDALRAADFFAADLRVVAMRGYPDGSEWDHSVIFKMYTQ